MSQPYYFLFPLNGCIVQIFARNTIYKIKLKLCPFMPRIANIAFFVLDEMLAVIVVVRKLRLVTKHPGILAAVAGKH